MDEKEIKLRVSRAERLRDTKIGNKDCENCPDTYSIRRKNTMTPLLLVIILVSAVIYVISQRSEEIYQGGGVINVAKGQKILYTTVSEPQRTGLSLILENKNSQPWSVSNIIIRSPNGEVPFDIQQEIPAKDIVAVFVPMPLDGKKYKIEVNPR
ncbi:MAG: hypothetical protein ACRC9L_09280 [Brevinema sp.]